MSSRGRALQTVHNPYSPFLCTDGEEDVEESGMKKPEKKGGEGDFSFVFISHHPAQV